MRVVVGMSGGVDSSVTAALLKERGYEVIGVFMNNWDEKDETGVCTSETDWSDVRAVADSIGIAYYSVNFAKQYYDRVFRHFLDEYAAGRTPNPDVLCNREIKFGELLRFAMSIEADRLATGHFAGVEYRDGRYRLLRAKDENKDQTYFLYMLNQKQLSMAMFPLGGFTKKEIRDMARERGLPVSEKKDSTGVCFIGERNFKKFLQGYLPAKPGDMVTREGRVMGRHDGLMYYTLGQRRGLGIGGSGNGGRWFVVEKDLKNNRLIVSQSEDELFTGSAACEQATWIAGKPPEGAEKGVECMVRLRHRQELQPCLMTVSGDAINLEFALPQRAVTPGQSAVIYTNDECLGGGILL